MKKLSFFHTPFSITYTHYNELKSQPHLMPHSVSVCGFIGHAFINKTKFCIILDQFFLAGQHKTFSALLSCILDCTLDQLSCISVFTIIRKCILMCDKEVIEV